MRLLSLYCTLTILIISCSTTKVVNTENNDLEKFRLFAINYNPKYDENEREKIFDLIKLPQIDSNLRRSIIISCQEYSKQSLEYLTLVLLKHYNYHFECCKQSYNLAIKLKITEQETLIPYYFIKISKIYPQQDFYEFVSSSIGYDFVCDNKYLLKNKDIKHIYTKIKYNLKIYGKETP